MNALHGKVRCAPYESTPPKRGPGVGIAPLAHGVCTEMTRGFSHKFTHDVESNCGWRATWGSAELEVILAKVSARDETKMAADLFLSMVLEPPPPTFNVLTRCHSLQSPLNEDDIVVPIRNEEIMRRIFGAARQQENRGRLHGVLCTLDEATERAIQVPRSWLTK